MKIGLNVSKVINIYNQNSKVDKNADIKKNQSDRIELSQTGKDLAKYIEMAKSSEVASRKIDEIKNQIQTGNYKVDSDKLARAILDSVKESDF